MASSNPNPNNNNKNKNKLSSSSLLLSGRAISDQTTTTTNTTFVQADPSNFRAVVQSLTGSTQLHPSSTQKLPFTVLAKPSSGEMGPRRPGFKLHERRKSAKKLEMIKLNNWVGSSISGSPRQREFGGEKMMVSPVSTLDLFARGSPKSPLEEEEERAIIADKGFYSHPRSPLSTPRGGSELQLLPLFPLHSPTK